MNQTLTNTTQLQQILDQEIVIMQSLTKVLDEEQLVLVENEAEKLEVITPNKNQLLAQVVELEKSRSELLNKAGYSNDNNGMQQFCAAQANKDNLDKAWNALLEISLQAQEKNRTNGMLISRHLNRNQATLNVLHSGSGHQAGSMYGADGQSKLKTTTARGIVAG